MVLRGGLAWAVGEREVVVTGRGYAGAHRAWVRDERRGVQRDMTAHNRRTHFGTCYRSQ
jgi:hypothetical protein